MKFVARQDLVDRMMTWGNHITDFRADHAADGLFVAQGCCDSRAVANDDDLTLVALNIAFWYWIDDRSDKYLQTPQSPVDWDSLIAITQRVAQPPEISERPESRFLSELYKKFEARTRSTAAFDYWLTTVAESLRGMAFEERVSRGRVVSLPSYSEGIEVGLKSVTTVNIMAGAYIANEMDRPSQDRGLHVANLERYFAISQRLMNDLFSVETERREGTAGCLSNSIINLERFMSPEQARGLVEEDKRGYDRLLAGIYQTLGESDPFVQVAQRMAARINQWYAQMPARYHGHPPA